MLGQMGKQDAEEPKVEFVDAARRVVAAALGADEPVALEGVWAEALARAGEAAGGPDVSVPRWLGTTVPLGIEEKIESHGIFPELTPEEAEKAARGYAPQAAAVSEDMFANYSSYEENQEAADRELERELEAGCLKTRPREVLEREVGPLTPSRVGVIVKNKNDITKVRLIHDLSRSGVNHRVQLPERVVLPRLCDVAEAARDFVTDRKADTVVEMLVLDFKDAFKQMHVAASEQKYLAGKCSLGWFIYLRVLFGGVCGPLL